MKINAMVIDQYKDVGQHIWESYAAGEKTAPMIVRLAEILDVLEPQGNDNLHTIWVTARRPTFRQYYNWHYEYDEPYKEASAKTLETAKDDYFSYYPLSKVWYRLSLKHFTRKTGEKFYAFFIDNNCVFTINDSNYNNVYDCVDLLEWAICEAETFVAEVRNGFCEKNVLERIPYIYRKGKIKRSDLWEAYPQSKKDFFKPYKKREIKKFYKYFKSDKSGNAFLPEMTARKFYEACAVVYNALGIHRETADYYFKETDTEREYYGGAAQTPKEMYYSCADARDDGLKNVPMDDPAAFEEWNFKKGPFYEFNGSHPWEIIPSFSTSLSINLYPRDSKNGRYYFGLSGSSDARAPKTIIAANALYEAGYPVVIYGMDEITDRIEGIDYISVVPIGEDTFFRGAINLPEGNVGLAIAAKTVWIFDDYRLKENTANGG